MESDVDKMAVMEARNGMKLKDLAYKCKDREIDCDNCPYEDICSRLNDKLEDISPCGLLTILEEEID